MTTAYQEFSLCGETIVLCQWQSTLGKVLFSLTPYSNNRCTSTLPLCHVFPLSEMTCKRLVRTRDLQPCPRPHGQIQFPTGPADRHFSAGSSLDLTRGL